MRRSDKNWGLGRPCDEDLPRRASWFSRVPPFRHHWDAWVSKKRSPHGFSKFYFPRVDTSSNPALPDAPRTSASSVGPSPWRPTSQTDSTVMKPRLLGGGWTTRHPEPSPLEKIVRGGPNPYGCEDGPGDRSGRTRPPSPRTALPVHGPSHGRSALLHGPPPIPARPPARSHRRATIPPSASGPSTPPAADTRGAGTSTTDLTLTPTRGTSRASTLARTEVSQATAGPRRARVTPT